MQDDDQLSIVTDESEDTFASISNLDNISDTTVLAITFLLSAEVSLTALVLDSNILTGGYSLTAFVLIGVLTMVLIFLSLNSIIRSLFPVNFYSESTGTPMLKSTWLPLMGNAEDQFEPIEQVETEPDDDGGHSVYQTFTEFFISQYGSTEDIEDYNGYKRAKLYQLKRVARRKANQAGVGLAWLRVAILSFVIQFGVAFLGVLQT